MPAIDDFIRPKEWVSNFVTDLGHVIRKWGEEKVIGLWVGGKALKTLENARYWYDLETL